MRTRVVAIARFTVRSALALLLAGCATSAPGVGSGGGPAALDLELQSGSGRPHDLPLTSPDVAADAEQARREIEARRGAKAAGDASRPDPTRRPDLDHDVTQGIQSRNQDRGLGR
jgi:hypothetical protein